MEKYFPHYGITEAEINLEYVEDDDTNEKISKINWTITKRFL